MVASPFTNADPPIVRVELPGGVFTPRVLQKRGAVVTKELCMVRLGVSIAEDDI
jgi:hypothetical protein